MKFPYDSHYQPPFPAVQVALHNREEGLRTSSMNALLDSGADASLVPIVFLREVIAPVLTDTRIRSHWGEWRAAQLFVVDVEIENIKLPGIFVVGDEQGDEIVLGRDVLNKLRIFLDGPARVVEIEL
jgi:predicted aspartyl protease